MFYVGVEGKVVVGGSIEVVSEGSGKRYRVLFSFAAVVPAVSVASVGVEGEVSVGVGLVEKVQKKVLKRYSPVLHMSVSKARC